MLCSLLDSNQNGVLDRDELRKVHGDATACTAGDATACTAGGATACTARHGDSMLPLCLIGVCAKGLMYNCPLSLRNGACQPSNLRE